MSSLADEIVAGTNTGKLYFVTIAKSNMRPVQLSKSRQNTHRMASHRSASRGSSRSIFGLRNARLASLMDNLIAIGLGLGLRLVVDITTDHNVKVGASIVGLWEGFVMDHFLEKTPRSSPSSFDPYIAYGIRLFVDFFLTESLWRLGIVLLWTGLGMVLAAIAPGYWQGATGFRDIYRIVRRDLVVLGITTLPFSSKSPVASRVQFAQTPSRTSESIVSGPSERVPRRPLKSRPLPGSFPGDWTDSESVVSNFPIPIPPPNEHSDMSHDSTARGALRNGFANQRVPSDDESDLSGDDHRLTAHDERLTDPGERLTEPGDRTPTLNTQPLPPMDDDLRNGADGIYAPDMSTLPNIPDLPGLGVPVPDDPTLYTSSDPTDVPIAGPSHIAPVLDELPENDDFAPDDISDAVSDSTVTDTVISGHGFTTLHTRANLLRQQAEAEDMERKQIELEWKIAKSERRWRDAFLLKGDLEDAENRISRLHKKAAEKYLLGTQINLVTSAVMVAF